MNADDPLTVVENVTAQGRHELPNLLCEELPAWDGLRRSFADQVMLSDDRVLQNLLIVEDRGLPSAKYFDFQPEVKPFMRRILTSWMLEVPVIVQFASHSLRNVISIIVLFIPYQERIRGDWMHPHKHL